jgi:hypothetical protein
MSRRFGTTGTQFMVRLNPPSDLNLNPVDHFLASVNNLFEHVLQDVQDSDMVGVTIHNEVNILATDFFLNFSTFCI